ncbi:MAG: hypothetical protein AVDCRST_MAG67-850, partial [uncultured Solirubrobacteraceae bacterium]
AQSDQEGRCRRRVDRGTRRRRLRLRRRRHEHARGAAGHGACHCHRRGGRGSRRSAGHVRAARHAGRHRAHRQRPQRVRTQPAGAACGSQAARHRWDDDPLRGPRRDAAVRHRAEHQRDQLGGLDRGLREPRQGQLLRPRDPAERDLQLVARGRRPALGGRRRPLRRPRLAADRQLEGRCGL